MSNHVFVLDVARQPLTLCHPARARQLLRQGKAAILRRYPLTLILKEAKPAAAPAPVRLKIDPGAKVTGMALVDRRNRVIFGAELTHRGSAIRDRLTARRQLRRARRSRKTRYRAPRFNNRMRPEGWLPPSLQHRVDTILTWVGRFRRFAPVAGLTLELVKFDTQLMVDEGIAGVQYQQGTLVGYEVGEYLLEKWGRTCQYCGAKEVPLEKEHIYPKSRGGSNRVSNLTLACHKCNEDKGNLPPEGWKAALVAAGDTRRAANIDRVLAKCKKPLADASAMNATRWALWMRLAATGLTVETGSGGRTKYNRMNLGYPKTHWIDAACAGESGTSARLDPIAKPLTMKAAGHGNRQMCGTDKFGFPIRHRLRQKRHFGFQTGDLVRAVVPKGRQAGIQEGRVLCRASGSFDIRTVHGRAVGISWRFCTMTHRCDGYSY